SDGTITPGSHDGMAVIAEDEETGIVTLCRNHEIRTLPDRRAFGPEEITYDERAGGGCVQLRFDTRNGRWLDARSSLSGTCRNCAGGPTPWGSWLTCEETVSDSQWDSEAGRGEHRPYAKTHGWIFEVPADRPAEAVPLKDMGRFIHEAVAVDPDTGSVYETEDRTTAGFYRFLPNTPGKLSDGGRLQMLKVLGRDQVQTGLRAGETFDVEWVDIDDPERPHHDDRKHETLGVFMQGQAKGGATFARLEGCWYGNGVVYLVATNGGDAGCGQIFSFHPKQQQLRLVFESPNRETLNGPDNVAVSRRGGIVLCEDGDERVLRLHGLTRDGRLFTLAANNIDLTGRDKNGLPQRDYRTRELAGACFSPDGRWLFFNVQTPGVTFAVTGPWEDGAL
ncbi:MAG: alkaline phosphatase PhoX, partial [Planctomycetaceae bacterium]